MEVRGGKECRAGEGREGSLTFKCVADVSVLSLTVEIIPHSSFRFGILQVDALLLRDRNASLKYKQIIVTILLKIRTS